MHYSRGIVVLDGNSSSRSCFRCKQRASVPCQLVSELQGFKLQYQIEVVSKIAWTVLLIPIRDIGEIWHSLTTYT